MVLGITGGIGTGKSTVLSVLKDKYNFKIYESDKIAHNLMKKGEKAYNDIVNYFGTDILAEDGEINRKILSQIVFSDNEKLDMLNSFVHKTVIDFIEADINKNINSNEKNSQNISYKNFVVESALLIESGCYRICDEIWYIYTDKEQRVARLKESRNMTEEKIESVIENQLSVDEFKKYSKYIIDNSGALEDTERQIQDILEAH